jgi:glycosyltransferase involved in cell wall biosynthesis
MAYLLLGSLAMILVYMSVRLVVVLRRFRIKKMYTAAIEAPSVSVCIPARNETHAMTQCLERVLESDYEKLEVVVYDDSSSDDTSILIKSFARAGVRFVPGDSLPEGWLGKNYALETLAREASGTYVIFMDVDTYVQPTTISQLVGYMTTEKLTMTSVIPGRNDIWRTSVLMGHLRYFWEALLSRQAAPATSSALWMIKRHVLLDTLGGFVSHKNEVEPEEHIAAIIGVSSYHCLVSDRSLGVTYEKKWTSQIETSRRLLLPIFGGRWYGAVLGLLFLGLLNIPFFLVLSGSIFGWHVIELTALCILIGFMILYAGFTHQTWRHSWWLGGLLWPLVIFQEFILFVRSVWGYATHTITWKGRLVDASPVHIDHLEINE